jgi:hypothetical protein
LRGCAIGRAHTQNIPLLKHQTQTRLTLVERQIADLGAEIAAQVAARTSTARRCEILRSMPGVGAVSAAAIQALMPEIGTLDRKQGTSLAGLAPITRQSDWAVWAIEGKIDHRLWQKTPARCSLFARACGYAFQPRPQNQISSAAQENLPKWPSPKSCETSSKWRMHLSKQIESGCPKGLDQDEYSAADFLKLRCKTR